jgi:hypothetical protein
MRMSKAKATSKTTSTRVERTKDDYARIARERKSLPTLVDDNRPVSIFWQRWRPLTVASR